MTELQACLHRILKVVKDKKTRQQIIALAAHIEAKGYQVNADQFAKYVAAIGHYEFEHIIARVDEIHGKKDTIERLKTFFFGNQANTPKEELDEVLIEKIREFLKEEMQKQGIDIANKEAVINYVMAYKDEILAKVEKANNSNELIIDDEYKDVYEDILKGLKEYEAVADTAIYTALQMFRLRSKKHDELIKFIVKDYFKKDVEKIGEYFRKELGRKGFISAKEVAYYTADTIRATGDVIQPGFELTGQGINYIFYAIANILEESERDSPKTKSPHSNMSNFSNEEKAKALKKENYPIEINNYYLQGLKYLRNKEFLKARNEFDKAAKLSEKEQLLLDIGQFCRGMVWYEDAPNYTGGKPTEYLNALDCFINALINGFEGDYIYFYLGDTAAKLGGGQESNYFDEKSKFFYRLLAIQSYIKSIKKNETMSEDSFFKLDVIHSPQNRTDRKIVIEAQEYFKTKLNRILTLAEMGIGDWLEIDEIAWDSYSYDLFIRNFFNWMLSFKDFSSKNNSQDILSLIEKGYQAHERKDALEAIHYLEKAMSYINDNSPEYIKQHLFKVTIDLGVNYKRINQLEKAYDFYKKALSLANNNLDLIETYNALGKVCYLLGKQQEAIHSYMNALYYTSITFSFEEAQTIIGNLFHHLGHAVADLDVKNIPASLKPQILEYKKTLMNQPNSYDQSLIRKYMDVGIDFWKKNKDHY
ncbi:tetratricopeptide repeat protein [Parageobacillus toebii]|uniref:Tetratricopeptide repeat protein n=1 Tax=Parageobacillus toebii TaxID=153151 RepID=A0A150N8Q4_9BACL|nr:tetratricopeptide repeat protein [Parageobacillus toebii]KYD33080.1 hypothetical protein B4110_3553 [Parageobacillus toebii]